MSHSQFHCIIHLYLDMHGLIFETSIWLLAGSTRYLSCLLYVQSNMKRAAQDWHHYDILPQTVQQNNTQEVLGVLKTEDVGTLIKKYTAY